MIKIGIIVANGTEDSELVVPVDIWNRAGIITKIISIHKKKNVLLANGIKVSCNETLDVENLSKYNAIYLPGGTKGVEQLSSTNTPKLINFLKGNTNSNVWFLSICAATSIYGKLGMLKGVKATCYPGYESSFKSSYVKQPVVVSKHFITANGPGSVFDFAFKVVEKLISPAMAKKVANDMLYKGIK